MLLDRRGHAAPGPAGVGLFSGNSGEIASLVPEGARGDPGAGFSYNIPAWTFGPFPPDSGDKN